MANRTTKSISKRQGSGEKEFKHRFDELMKADALHDKTHNELAITQRELIKAVESLQQHLGELSEWQGKLKNYLEAMSKGIEVKIEAIEKAVHQLGKRSVASKQKGLKAN